MVITSRTRMCIHSFALFFQQGRYLCIANSPVLVLSILLDYIYSVLIECHRMSVETQELGLVNCLEVLGDIAFTFFSIKHAHFVVVQFGCRRAESWFYFH
jgi:hypothetical protein